MSWILLLAPPLGVLAIWWLLKPFSDDPHFVRELFRDLPVTMIAASSMVGAILLWIILQALGRW
jgi:lysylphosphatidylglycerol synthetase-like protein (DUF2156 family)